MSKTIGERIKDARIQRGITQEDVAKRLGIGRAAYSNIENGHSLVSVEHLINLCRILSKPPSYFLGMIQDTETDELVAIFRTLPPGAKHHARLFIEALGMFYSVADQQQFDKDRDDIRSRIKRLTDEQRAELMRWLREL